MTGAVRFPPDCGPIVPVRIVPVSAAANANGAARHRVSWNR